MPASFHAVNASSDMAVKIASVVDSALRLENVRLQVFGIWSRVSIICCLFISLLAFSLASLVHFGVSPLLGYSLLFFVDSG